MKKKSPPYAIIGAAVLGIIAVFVYLQHEKAIQADAAAILKAAQDKAAADLAAANASRPAPVTAISEPTNSRRVYYATQPIDPGVRISPSFFELKLTPNDVLPDAYAEGPNVDLVGMFATRGIEKGDPFTPRNVSKDLPFMSGRITPGMRLLALPIFNSDANATGGFVVDGDKVDLLYTTGASTQLAMQNLQVLYVPGTPIRTEKTGGVNPAPAPGDPISVAFEVTPEQAQALVYMTQNPAGHFSMILRSRRDTENLNHLKPFNGSDYADNIKKIQRTTDIANARVLELQKQIEAEEEKNKAQGNTNAPPIQPSP